jgi:hypothetical protein
MLIITAALGIVSCGAGEARPKSFAEREIAKLVSQPHRVEASKVRVSSDKRTICGVAMINGRRVSPFSIELDRPFPTHTAIRADVQPSIDEAGGTLEARDAATKALSRIIDRCIAAGANPAGPPRT